MGLYHTYDRFHYRSSSPFPSGISRAVVIANRNAYDYLMVRFGNYEKDAEGNIKSLAQLKAEALATFPTATGFERYENIEEEKLVA